MTKPPSTWCAAMFLLTIAGAPGCKPTPSGGDQAASGVAPTATPTASGVAQTATPTASGAAPKDDRAASRATLEVKLASPKIARGQDVVLGLQLKNTSAQPLWINQRMLLNAGHAPAMMREVWLEISGPSGAAIPFTAKVRAGEATASDYAVVGAGQSASKELNLSRAFELTAPGTYKLIAHYQDGSGEAPKASGGAVHLAGELASAPVTFTLE